VLSPTFSGFCFYFKVLLLQFLGMFEKLRKATISFVMSICPSAWNNPAPTRQIFMKFDIWVIFVNLSKDNSSFIKI